MNNDYQPIDTSKWGIDPEKSHAIIGIQLHDLKPEWLAAGVLDGEFLFSTSHTGDITTLERAVAALKAPKGTELMLQRVRGKVITRRIVTL